MMVLGMAPTNFISSPQLRRSHVRAAILALAVAVLALGCGAGGGGVSAIGGQSTSQSSTDALGVPESEFGEVPDGNSWAESPRPAPGERVTSSAPTAEPAWEPTTAPQTGQSPSPEGPATTTGTPSTVLSAATEEGNTGGSVEDSEMPGGYAELISPERVRGGLVLLPEPRLPVQFVNEVVDLCHDSAAFILANGRVLGPGDEATDEELFEVHLFRAVLGVDCDEPEGRRYSYVDMRDASTAYSTVAEAVAYRDRIVAGNADSRKRWEGGTLLGYAGRYRREFPLEERDEVVVVAESVSVADGTVRGLVHNLSETLYARNVVVTARPSGGASEAGGVALSWRWPLTVQPGERAPFEIDGWQGGVAAADADLSVSADLSGAVDITRSFGASELRLNDKEVGERVVMFAIMRIPTTHPELAELIWGQTIKDFRVYAALLDRDDGSVVEVEQLDAGMTVWDSETQLYVPISIDSYPPSPDSIPDKIAARGDHHFETFGPNQGPMVGFLVEFQDNDYQVWVGGASPPPVQQPTGG